MGVLAAVVTAASSAWALPAQWTIENIAANSIGWAINGSGQVIGDEFGVGSWLYSNGTVTALPTNHYASGLNDSGQVVGSTSDNRAFVYENGTTTLLPLPMGNSFASGINNSGQIVGQMSVTGTGSRAFLYDQNGPQVLGANFCSGAAQCFMEAIDINENGQTVGRGFREFTNTPLLLQGESFVNLTTRGLTNNAIPTAINEAGSIIGNSYDSPTARGFLLKGDEVTYFDAFNGFLYSYAWGINNSEQVVGIAVTSAGVLPWIYDGNALFDLNTLNIAFADGWDLREPRGINDAGQIVGYGLYNGQSAAFLLSPVVAAVPEPQTYLTMLLGLLLLTGVARRRAGRNVEAT
jgi:probable HAF family extracellular repeat protein